MENQPSARLVDQRIRNRIMDCLELLADGDDGVLAIGPGGYFEFFYDWIPHRDDGPMRPNSALSDEEAALLAEVSAMLDDACDATPASLTADELMATGWPRRIQPVARRALDLMRRRGRFSEEREEEAPGSRGP